MRQPRILIAAPASGSGKTMITCGLLQALCDRGLRVSSFKCGPDYIDPMFHEKVIGTKSGNLDLFFAPPDTLRRLFLRNSAGTEISVIEGVMGYYDGLGAATETASSYDVARSLAAPTVLIVNARGQSLSALATLEGFLRYRPDSGIRGVIFNQMSQHIFAQLQEQVRDLGVEPLGYVPKAEDMVIESRHLGLVTPGEIADLSARLKKLSALLETTIDFDALLRLADAAPALEAEPEPERAQFPGARVAVARDEAFCFFYRDNLALLEQMGAQLLYFSPIHDSRLPEGANGLLLVGGYPELYGKALSENTSMLESVRAALAAGLPCLAECGGFLYLHRELEDMEGNFWPQVGFIEARAWRTKKLGRFGYITLSADAGTPLLPKGETVRGHEFHYFESGDNGADFTAEKPITGKRWQCVHAAGASMAGFPHLFYESNPHIAERFLRACAERR